MNKLYNGLAIVSATLLGVSCAEKLSPERSLGAVDSQSSKIVNSRAASLNPTDCNSLLVKLHDSSDLVDVESVCGDELLSVEKLFPSVKGKEELEARFGLDRWFEVKLKGESEDVKSFATRISEIDAVESVQYSVRFKRASDGKTYPYRPDTGIYTKAASSGLFNDPGLPDQWHYINTGKASVCNSVFKGADINVADVWDGITTGDSRIVVAVVDEGVKFTHPDLTDNMWVNTSEIAGNGIDDDNNGYIDDIHGFNFVTGGEISWSDFDPATGDGDNGHGTHCAGTIAAVNNNGIGISGVAGGSGNGDGVRIMSCQIFSGTHRNNGTPAVSAKAIKYAADMGASIISCSFGYDAGSFNSDQSYLNGNGGLNMAEYDAIRYFEATRNNDVLDGGLVIFAAGNDGKPYASYPGALNDVISVSAFGPDYLPTHYTNYGPGCNITAPGGEAYLKPWTNYNAMVLSTLPSEVNGGEDYGYMQGTSMACPHVSGIAALGLSYALKLGKEFSMDTFKQMIVTSANDFDNHLTRNKDYVSNAPSEALNLKPSRFRQQMGTGSVDAWRLMMKIEGIPCLVSGIGKRQWLDLSEYLGTSSVNLTYLGVEVSEEAYEALGLAELPYIQYGRLYIHPTKCGAAKMTVKVIGGGTAVGGDNAIGGMEISQEISIIARNTANKNGGWL